MWKNYWLTSLRTIKQNKFYVGVNLLSMAVAISLCTIAWFNFQYNHSFNSYFVDADSLYKLNSILKSGDNPYGMGSSAATLASALNENVGGIQAARYHKEFINIRLDDRLFRESIAFVDPQFLELFQFQRVQGSTSKLGSKSDVLISESTSIRLFGDQNPEGQVFELVQPNGKMRLFKVSGVLAKLPINTSFDFDMIMHFDNYFDIYGLSDNDPVVWIDATFAKLQPNSSPPELDSSMRSYIERQNKANKGIKIESLRMDSILEWPKFERDLYKSSFRSVLHPASVTGTISSAVAILLLACFNFVNTNIAISRKRLKEIGVRKVVGGTRRGLIIQFFGESLFQIFVAIVFSGFISYYLTEMYNALFHFEIVQFEFLNILPFALFLVFLWLSIGIFAGIYPALYISAFPAIEILKDKIKFSSRNWFAKILLGFQFAVCVYNIFALIVFVQNAEYQEKLDRGYEINQVLNIPINVSEQYDILKSKLEQNPMVSSVVGTSDIIGNSFSDVNLIYGGLNHNVAGLSVGLGYLETLGVRLLQGDFIGIDKIRKINSIVVNNSFAKRIGDISDNDVITVKGERYRIHGVVEDFNLKTIMLKNKIQPAVIFIIPKEEYSCLAIKTTSNDIIDLNKQVEAIWYDLFPNELYSGYYQEDVMIAVRHTNKIMININVFIAIISILISILGLYSMASLTVQNRIKEFGIRKVLGASRGNIAYLINRDLIILLSISSVIGLISSNFIINNLLDIIYAYHMEIQWTNYTWPVVVIFLISGITVGLKIWHAARSNPVEHLRME